MFEGKNQLHAHVCTVHSCSVYQKFKSYTLRCVRSLVRVW